MLKSFIISFLVLCNGEEIKASPDRIFYNDKNEVVVSQNIAEGSWLPHHPHTYPHTHPLHNLECLST